MNKLKIRKLINNSFTRRLYYTETVGRSSASSVANRTDTSTTVPTIPTETNVLIYGNDLTTLSIAYHLSEELNGSNCIVITGNKLDSNSRSDPTISPSINSCSLSHVNVANPRVAQLIQYNKQLFNISTCGALYLASNQRTVDSFRRRISSAKIVFNDPKAESIELLSKDDINRQFPQFLFTDDIKSALYVPNDGLIEDISGQQNRLKQLSEDNGIKFFDNLLLNKININNNRISNVEVFDCTTNCVTRIECNYFINASNNYLTRLIAKRSVTRVRVPTLCIHNQILKTKPFNDFNVNDSQRLPVIHDFDQRFTVYQTSDRSLTLTGYEIVSKILLKSK